MSPSSPAGQVFPDTSPALSPIAELAPSADESETNLPTEVNTFDQQANDREMDILEKCGVTEEDRRSSLLSSFRNMSGSGVLEDESTSEFTAATWLDKVDGLILCPNETDAIQQRYAVAVIYYSLGGSGWTNCSDSFTSWCRGEVRWLSPEQECNWFGLSCNDNNVVTIVSLKRNNLIGLIPQTLFNLNILTSISLDHNKISGSIPKEFGLLQDLEILELDDNQIRGSIPTTLYSLSSLKALDLNLNHLSGTIAEEIGNLPNLMVLQIENNKLTGSIPWFGLAMDQELRKY